MIYFGKTGWNKLDFIKRVRDTASQLSTYLWGHFRNNSKLTFNMITD